MAFHVKFNDEFYGLGAGTIATDILKPKNGRWTYQDKSTRLKENDVVYYWVHVVYRGLGYNLVDQEHRVTSKFFPCLIIEDFIICKTKNLLGFYDVNGQQIGTPNSNNNVNNDNTNNNNPSCQQSATKLYNSVGVSRNACSGELLFEDHFKDLNQLEKNKWTVVEKFSGAPVSI